MEHFSAAKFAIGYEKNMSFLVIAKSPKVWKKVEKIALGSLRRYCTSYSQISMSCALSQNYQHLLEK